MSRDVSEQSRALAVWCWRLRCDHASSHPREEAIAFMPADLHLISGKGTYRHERQRFGPVLQARQMSKLVRPYEMAKPPGSNNYRPTFDRP
jgi:hypothetical protein